MGWEDIRAIHEALDWYLNENIRMVTRRKNPVPLTDEMDDKIERLRTLVKTFKKLDNDMGSEIEFVL